MEQASVKEVRDNLRAYLDRAEAGEEIAVMRRGREVARIVPQPFPDLAEFRQSITLRESMSTTVIRQRRESMC